MIVADYTAERAPARYEIVNCTGTGAGTFLE